MRGNELTRAGKVSWRKIAIALIDPGAESASSQNV